jgi:uncharacterized protein YprB with RNaseH-like and TPR domain
VRSFRERYGALNPQSPRPVQRTFDGLPIEALEAGMLRHNAAGEVFIGEAHHSEPRLTALSKRQVLESRLYFNQPLLSGIKPTDILFLDTETTGLAGGTGTHAFLVGVGYFDGFDFTMHQFFMRSPAEEPSLLEELRILFMKFPVLVTFNGKSFDWPLLDTRFVMHGYRLTFDFTHLDLLHPARRIWKHRLTSCSLTSLEQEIYGVQRVGDVPGFLIPQLYFDYLRDGDARRLKTVFAHNRADIVTLARLLETLLTAESTPEAELSHPEDRMGLAFALLAAGELDRGQQILAAALESQNIDPALRRRGQVELWRLLRRSGRTGEGIAMLETMCTETTRSIAVDPFPYVELAKYYEHVARDYQEAERVIERAMRLLDLYGERSHRHELMYRLQRIQRKRVSNR